MKEYSRAEVLKHNIASDCWIIIQNNVYNITAFVKQHPGGSDILLSRAGEDATSYFITKHGKSPKATGMLKQYLIGTLTVEDRITANDFEEPFLTELIDHCYKEKLYKSPPLFQNPIFYIR